MIQAKTMPKLYFEETDKIVDMIFKNNGENSQPLDLFRTPEFTYAYRRGREEWHSAHDNSDIKVNSMQMAPVGNAYCISNCPDYRVC